MTAKRRQREPAAPSALLKTVATGAGMLPPPAANDAAGAGTATPQPPQRSAADEARVQAMLNALGQQREATADAVVNLAGEVAALKSMLDNANRVAGKAMKLCAEACDLGLQADKANAPRLQQILAQVRPPEGA